MGELHLYWNKLNGDSIVDSLESSWIQWTTKDVVKWFKYALSANYSVGNINGDNDNDNDYVADNLSDDDSNHSNNGMESDHENYSYSQNDANANANKPEKIKKQQSDTSDKGSKDVAIDYSVIEGQLIHLKFCAKKHLPLIQDEFHLCGYGFENNNDRKILCQATKELMKKYPKKDIKKRKDKNKNKNKQEKTESQQDNDLEGR